MFVLLQRQPYTTEALIQDQLQSRNADKYILNWLVFLFA
jgi:hypothetical protein